MNNDQPAEPVLPNEEAARPFFRRIFETAKLFIVEPQAAYRRMSGAPDFGRALAYGILVGWLGASAGLLWGLALQSALLSLLQLVEGGENFGQLMFVQLGFGAIWLVLAPAFLLVSIFITALLYHLFLMLLGGTNRGFVSTLNVVCYAQTAQLAQVVPLVGGLVSLIWVTALAIIGLCVVHRTSAAKAAAAVLLPMLLACVCAFAAVILIVTLALAAAGALSG